METKTKLSTLVEKLTQDLTAQIESAIENGAEIKPYGKTAIDVDGFFLMDTRKAYGRNTFDIVLHMDSEKIAKVFDKATEPSNEELNARARELRTELTKIENQLKEKEANNETNND